MCYLANTVFSVLILFISSNQTNSISTHPLLLVISFDGFRYNYFERNLTQEMVKLRPKGTYAEYMTSVFPSKTFPNHFSIGTGMYADVHGILDNKVFDPELNKELNYTYDMFHYNKDIVPIWTLNEREGFGRHSGIMMWPGGDFEYQGIKPKYYKKYEQNVTWEARVDTLMSWFVNEEDPINLGMMYFEEPDYIMHTYGPDSPMLNKQLVQVNAIVEYLMKKIEENQLSGKLNVIMLSDHGAQAVPFTHIIDLNKYLSNTTYSMYGVSPNLQIYPKPGKYEDVLKSLKNATNYENFTVYSKDEILYKWHYKDNGRCPPILVVANVSYAFHDQLKYAKKLIKLHGTNDLSNITFGTHGYDPEVKNMRAFFMAFGPLIKRNHIIKPFVNIDLYPLFAHMLKLKLPDLKPNGTLDSIIDILKSDTNLDPSYFIIAGVVLCAMCFIVVVSVIYRRLRNNKQRKSSLSTYRVLAGSEETSPGFEGSKLLVTSEYEEDSPS